MTKKYYETRILENPSAVAVAKMIAEENGWDLVNLIDQEDPAEVKAVFYCRPYGYTLKEEQAMERCLND